MTRRLGVLISGRGSNLKSILEAIVRGQLDAHVGVVVANQAGAGGLAYARDAGIATEVLEHRHFATRGEYDAELVRCLRRHDVGLVCLAGFMRVLGPVFVDAYRHAILNIHPSLLPAFPGVHAQRQAFDYGVALAGCTVHFVTEELDAGPIVSQAAVPVLPHDTPETLAARILAEEHRLYPAAIARVLQGGWRIEGRRFVDDAAGGAQP